MSDPKPLAEQVAKIRDEIARDLWEGNPMAEHIAGILLARIDELERDQRPFPMQGDRGSPAGTIPWWLAEIAHASYSAMYGRGQSLERLAERHGFGWQELGALLDGIPGGGARAPSKNAIAALREAWAKRNGATP